MPTNIEKMQIIQENDHLNISNAPQIWNDNRHTANFQENLEQEQKILQSKTMKNMNDNIQADDEPKINEKMNSLSLVLDDFDEKIVHKHEIYSDKILIGSNNCRKCLPNENSSCNIF